MTGIRQGTTKFIALALWSLLSLPLALVNGQAQVSAARKKLAADLDREVTQVQRGNISGQQVRRLLVQIKALAPRNAMSDKLAALGGKVRQTYRLARLVPNCRSAKGGNWRPIPTSNTSPQIERFDRLGCSEQPLARNKFALCWGRPRWMDVASELL